MWSLTQNLDPIGSAVLTFIGYKWKNKQTDKQSIFIEEKNKTFKCRKMCEKGNFTEFMLILQRLQNIQHIFSVKIKNSKTAKSDLHWILNYIY